jgi:hypothetical protein
VVDDLGAAMKALAVVALLAACSGEAVTPIDAPPFDAPIVMPRVYKQVEVLARPGIAEALLVTNSALAIYNASGPGFAGVNTKLIEDEAKTVLKALYLGACLLNGALGLTVLTGLKPGGVPCEQVGGAIFVENSLAGVNLEPTVAAAAQAYANRVFAQVVPDVMRVDMSLATSNYENLCGDPLMPLPLLCGGRFLDDDTIDVTYDYLLNGANLRALTGGAATYNQVSALVSDGVNFSDVTAQNKNNRVPSVATNPAQFHTTSATPAPVSTTFPYAANPQ